MASSSPRSITVVNPATGSPEASYPTATPTQIDQALTQLGAVQPQWQAVPLRRRAAVLHTVADLLLQKAVPLAQLVATEVGKPVTEAQTTDVTTAANSFRTLAKLGLKTLSAIPSTPWQGHLLGRRYQQRRWPHGVVAIITPWNYPLATPASALAAALMAGNTVAFKPSERTPGCGLALHQLIQQALADQGLSPDVIACLLGDRQVGEALTQDPRIHYAVFTGSVAGGRQVQQAMAQQGRGCTLELGGSDPMLVLPSAQPHLDTVLSYALWGRFTNAGQTCAAVKRLLVPQALLAESVERLSAKLHRLQVGMPRDPATHMGPLIDTQQRQRVQDQLAQARLEQPAQVIQAALPPHLPKEGCFFPPTLVVAPPPDSVLLRQEVFGPVLAILPYQSAQEWTAHGMGSPFGLGVSVFGALSEARAIAARWPAANVAINDLPLTHYALPALPWGGWKDSGPGYRNGVQGLLEMTRLQVCSEMRHPSPAPWLFGKTPSSPLDVQALAQLLVNNRPSLGLLRYLWAHRPSSRL